jgi:three-Cys-motif partner protein
LDPSNITVLQQRCSASPYQDRIQYFVADSNLVVNDIAQHIKAIKKQSLNLAFLDPPALELNWRTVESLAQVPKMDLIIHYPQGILNRYMSQASETDSITPIDRFFGGTEWREIYKERVSRTGVKAGLHRQLIDYYKTKLRALGYVKEIRELGNEPLMRNVQRQAPLYRLLFASKHPIGEKFWKEVTRRDVYGQSRLL